MSDSFDSYQRVSLPEWGTAFLKDALLSEADRKLASELASEPEARLTIDEMRDGVRIQARSWIGVVRFDSFELLIEPKLAGDQLGLVKLIEFTTGLDALKANSGARDLLTGGADLFDLVSLLFVEACERLVRDGLFSDYIEHEDELPMIRGRLLADRQVLEKFGRIDKLLCRFDEQHLNLPENQLLAIALRQCGRRAKHDRVRRRARALQAIFEDVCDPRALDLPNALFEITYHRLNEHYRDSHELAWFVLDGLGVKDLNAPGKTGCFAFLVDMNALFEKFVYRLANTILPLKKYRVRYQFASRSIIWNASLNKPYARVIPDLLIDLQNRAGTSIAVDAKYKTYDERKIASQDIYQTFLYAYAYGGVESHASPSAILIYPSTSSTTGQLRLHIKSVQASSQAQVFAVGIDIPAALAEATTRSVGPATTPLTKLIAELCEGREQAPSKHP